MSTPDTRDVRIHVLEREVSLLKGENEAVASAAAHERAAQEDWRRAYGVQGQRLALLEQRVTNFESLFERMHGQIERLSADVERLQAERLAGFQVGP